MTREQKKAKRQARSLARYNKKLRDRNALKERFYHEPGLPMFAVRSIMKRGYAGAWSDPSSPTGLRQVCSYRGTCQFPCNGDC